MTKYLGQLRKRFNTSDYPVFTLADVRVFLDRERISQTYLKLILNRLIRNNEIRRIRKGAYTFHGDMAVVGFAYRPFYYGLEDALSYRNLWTQETNPVVLTPNTAREGVRKFGNANYIVKRVRPRLFFGFDFIKHYDLWLPVSDPEKTLIDLVYYKHGLRKEVARPLSEVIDRGRLEEYLKKYGKTTRKNVYKQLQLSQA